MRSYKLLYCHYAKNYICCAKSCNKNHGANEKAQIVVHTSFLGLPQRVSAQSLSRVQLSVTLCTLAHQAPLPDKGP